jgi:hypothetical protein
VLRGHNGPALNDGYLARFTLGPKSVEKIEVPPIVGKGQPEGHTGPYDSKLFQPTLMQGAPLAGCWRTLRNRSAALDTTMPSTASDHGFADDQMRVPSRCCLGSATCKTDGRAHHSLKGIDPGQCE